MKQTPSPASMLFNPLYIRNNGSHLTNIEWGKGVPAESIVCKFNCFVSYMFWRGLSEYVRVSLGVYGNGTIQRHVKLLEERLARQMCMYNTPV